MVIRAVLTALALAALVDSVAIANRALTQAPALLYTFTDLGALAPGGYGPWGVATAVSATGQVAIRFCQSATPVPGTCRAFVYKDGAMIDLGAGAESYPTGINAAGQVVGYSNGIFARGFLYSDGVITHIPGAAGHTNEVPQAINDAGQIVGYSYSSMPALPSFATQRAFLHSGGTSVALMDRAHARAINAAGQVAGHHHEAAAFGDHNPFLFSGGRVVNLGGAGGSIGAQASGINDSGMVVGSVLSNSRRRAFVFAQGTMSYLGEFSQFGTSAASAINGRAQIVGTSDGRAFVYANGVMTDLNTVTSVPIGFTLSSALAINDSGLIVGELFDSQDGRRPFLLTPIAAAAPGFTRSPVSQGMVVAGNLTLSALAAGNPPPAYRWQISRDAGITWTALDNGAAFSGVTTGTLTVTSATTDLNGTRFRALATNSAGEAASAAATLTVASSLAAPVITGQPSSHVLVSGNDVELTASVTGTAPLSYQWHRDGVPVTGGTQQTLRITYAHPTHTGSYTVTVTNSTGSATSLPATLTVHPHLTVKPESLSFGAVKFANSETLATVTPDQAIAVSFAESGIAWTADANTSWVRITGGSGTGNGQFTVGITNPGNVIADASELTAHITVTPAKAGVSPLHIPITLRVKAPALSSPPFGAFDLPANGASVSGSIAVTGWALDDVGVTRVEIWRDLVAGETTPPFAGGGRGQGKVFIANAFFVSGARADIEQIYANQPLTSRAGWGYLLMTQGLWNQNGTFTLHAFAFDQDGNSATLGSKTITVNNAEATKPFGSIDTPGYGQAVTSSLWNYGWALTPNAIPSCTIGPGGVQVSIDSGPLTPVSYGDLRSDIAGFFPGLTNSNGSGGAYYVDTSSLSNGTHQIGWFVTDSCGRSEGIGSRFFTVLNGSAAAPPAGSRASAAMPVAAVSEAAIEVRRGDATSVVSPNSAGDRVVPIRQDERVEVQLPALGAGAYDGYQIVKGQRRPLPLGSSFDRTTGTFYWQPAAGFLGVHDLQFVAANQVVRVRAVVQTAVHAAIDAPQQGRVSVPFMVAGWAIDLGAREGSGIDTVHVWAYPDGGAAPIFLGVAAYGDRRPDIAATFGEQFAGAAYGLAVDNLSPGTYNLVVYPHSAVTGDFHGARVVRVTVP
jgi:probable HAF family extracellular repeat protein